jgi:hypothetical protein
MEQTSGRPTAITVVCVLCFIGAALVIPAIFSEPVRSIGSWYPPYLAGSAIVGLTCMIGLWHMRKWAVFAYTIFVVINQIVLVNMDIWNPFALLIPAIVIAIGFTYLTRMH